MVILFGALLTLLRLECSDETDERLMLRKHNSLTRWRDQRNSSKLPDERTGRTRGIGRGGDRTKRLTYWSGIFVENDSVMAPEPSRKRNFRGT